MATRAKRGRKAKTPACTTTARTTKARRALAPYRSKRDFSKTAEPAGDEGVRSSARLRFVVQKHAARRLHYDLRLELDGVFKSWAVTRGPSDDPSDKRLAVEVEDHPLEYGDFEGTIPAGEYGGGTVQLWDRGYWIPEGSKTPEQALAAGELKFTLEGERLHGGWVLVRMRRDRMGGSRTNWLLIKHRDACARADHGAVLLAADSSVASGRTLEEIAAGRGRAPRPFMLKGRGRVSADAVWRSNHAEGGGERGAQGEQSAVRDRSVPARVVPFIARVRRDAGTAVDRIPDFVKPGLCRFVDEPPSGDRWVHEVKFDGYRLQLRVVDGAARLRTRTGLDWTERFAAIAADAARLPDCLIDGEVVAFDRRHVPSFEAVQAALAANDSENLTFFAFDLLFEGRRDLRALPLGERKAHLEALLARHPSEHIRYVEHLEASGGEVLHSACEMGLEGIVSKRLDAPYVSGRSDVWRKSKCRPGQEVVLGGWTTKEGTVRSLLAGVYKDDKLVYVGRIGTGFGRETVRTLLPKLKALTTERSPFVGPEAPRREPDVRWLVPKLVAEIEIGGWTSSGMIRQSAFKGLRQDKPAREVRAERPLEAAKASPNETPRGARARARSGAAPARSVAARAGAPSRASAPVRGGASPQVLGVTISNPDKPMWPDGGDGTPVTKLDLARYFERVGPWMLPYIEGRPCSLVRAPDGIGAQQFFQRHAMAGMSKLFSMVEVKGDRAPYVQIDRIEALAAVAQLGGLELHPWNCAPHEPEIPGRLVFDLDPAPDVKFDDVVAAALELRGRLKSLGLESFCKTTGGKGLHVVVPLDASARQAVEWEAAKNFAHLICAQMMHDTPSKYLDTMSKSERVSKIFLDYLRNERTASAVAVLSTRARPLAPVSMPLTWREVKPGLDPKRFTLRSVPALLKRSTAWSGYDAAAASLKTAIRLATNGSRRARAR